MPAAKRKTREIPAVKPKENALAMAKKMPTQMPQDTLREVEDLEPCCSRIQAEGAWSALSWIGTA